MDMSPLSRIKVLHVNDDEGDRLLLRTESQRNPVLAESVTWSEAEHIKDALRQLVLPGCPDILLLDLGLPGLSGVAAIRHLVLSYPKLPIVVLTGVDDVSLGPKLVAEGADDHLPKSDVFCNGRGVERLLASMLKVLARRANQACEFQGRCSLQRLNANGESVQQRADTITELNSLVEKLRSTSDNLQWADHAPEITE